jgi:hypothetical protein
MPITLQFVQEDGTGKSNATSYASVDEFKQFWMNRGVAYTVDADIKAWLNVGTAYIDSHYSFFGEPSAPDTQALQWPRSGLRNSKKELVPSDSIPVELKNALCLLARQAKENVDLEAEVNDGIASKSIGPVSISYRTGYKPDFHQATNFLKFFIKNKAALQVVS